jgi:hypothetical protein
LSAMHNRHIPGCFGYIHVQGIPCLMFALHATEVVIAQLCTPPPRASAQCWCLLAELPPACTSATPATFDNVEPSNCGANGCDAICASGYHGTVSISCGADNKYSLNGSCTQSRWSTAVKFVCAAPRSPSTERVCLVCPIMWCTEDRRKTSTLCPDPWVVTPPPLTHTCPTLSLHPAPWHKTIHSHKGGDQHHVRDFLRDVCITCVTLMLLRFC